MAPSARRSLNGTGVRRIPGRKNRDKNRDIRIGTWNVRSLSPGKVHNVCKEMSRLKIDVLGLSDVRWKGQGHKNIDDDHILYYSGSDESSNLHGVGVVINIKRLKTAAQFVPQSRRTMMLQLQAKPRNINLIQAYAPIKDSSQEDIDEFYKEVQQLWRITKKHEVNILMGDFNAKIGEGEVQGVVGKHGLGKRNDRGDLLVQFCQDNDIAVMNTFFQLPPRRLYTWTSPKHTREHIMRNQIDFIMINNRFKNSFKSVKTYPGADVRTDHNPVIGVLSCQLKNIKKTNSTVKLNIRNLADIDIRDKVTKKLNDWALAAKQQSPKSIEESWSDLKNILSEVNHQYLKVSFTPKQKWMTNKILMLMEERRLHKNVDVTKYNNLDHQIRREVRYARDQWYSEKCKHIEKLFERHDAFNLHKEIRSMIGTVGRTNGLVDEMGLPVLDIQKKKQMWEQYIFDMFTDDSRSILKPIDTLEGHSILKQEVWNALKRAKIGKSSGPDGIHIEVLKLILEDNIDGIVELMNLVYETGELPKDWLVSTFVTLPKKSNAKKCQDYRTISLMSQILKLFLSIIHDRIKTKCDEQLSDSQFGFRSGVGTREALFAIQVLVQKCKEMQQDVYMCFIDYEKAFDRVLHDRLISLLADIGLDQRDIRIIQSLYWNQRATVRIDGQESEEVEIKRGVRQGCILSPTLFNIYSEAIMAEALEDLDCGVKVNGRLINNLRYADDTVLIASSEQELQKIVDRVNVCSEKAGLELNVAKTKVMVVSTEKRKDAHIFVGGHILEQVQKYKYLGTWLNEPWDSDQEIKTRIEIARSSFNRMKRVLCNRNLKISLRIRMLRCYIWPILLYGCEAWTIKEDLRKRVEAFEMWAYRRMLRIGWTQKVTNDEVLRRVNQKRELLQTVKQRKVAYLGHVMRHDRYELLQLIMMGKVAGKRKVGRRKKSWLRNIREWTGIASAAQLFRLAKDRGKFAELTANLR